MTFIASIISMYSCWFLSISSGKQRVQIKHWNFIGWRFLWIFEWPFKLVFCVNLLEQKLHRNGLLPRVHAYAPSVNLSVVHNHMMNICAVSWPFPLPTVFYAQHSSPLWFYLSIQCPFSPVFGSMTLASRQLRSIFIPPFLFHRLQWLLV